jgi:hypothetical protein
MTFTLSSLRIEFKLRKLPLNAPKAGNPGITGEFDRRLRGTYKQNEVL